MKKAYFLFLLMSLPLMVKAYDAKIDGIYYILNSSKKTAIVTSMDTWGANQTAYSGDIVIPKEILYNNITYKVSSIAEKAFYECAGLTSVTIQEGVQEIGRQAFDHCTNMKSIVIPNTVKTIGEAAFNSCQSLEEIELPNSLEALHDRTFLQCSSLKSIIVPNSVKSIEGKVFSYCTSLEFLYIPRSVESITNIICEGCSSLSFIQLDWEQPIDINPGVFDNTIKNNAVLLVPNGTKGNYSLLNGWKDFVVITEARYYKYENGIIDDRVSFSAQWDGSSTNSWGLYGTTYTRVANLYLTNLGNKSVNVVKTIVYGGSAKLGPASNLLGVLEPGNTINGSKTISKVGSDVVDFPQIFVYYVYDEVLYTKMLSVGVDAVYNLEYQVDDITYKDYFYKFNAEIVPEPEPSKNGYIFSGWSVIPATMPANDVTITGTFFLPTTEDVITITSAGQTTWCSDKNLDFTSYPDLKAYVATGYDKASGTIWLTRVKEVPANTGFLLMGEAGSYEIPAKTGDATSYYMNLFKGTIEGTTIYTTDGDFTNYYLSNGDAGVGFYKVQGSVELKPNRAYLSVPTEIPAIGTAGSTETIKVSAAGQVPYYNTASLDFSSLDAQGVKAYTATGYDYTSGTIWLTRVKQVPAETGILIMAPQGEYPVPTASVASVYANMFKGTLTGTTIQTHETIAGEDYINYYLSSGDAGVGFYRVTKAEGVTIGANRCYLPIKNKEAAGTRSANSGQNQIAFQEADEVIGIPLFRGIDGDEDGTTNLTPALSKGEGDGEWYTLQGQRVAKPGKGLYIRNGKKVVIK